MKPPKRTLALTPLDKARPHEVIWEQVAGIFEATRRGEGITFVYFIGEADDGPVKIGLAKDPIARLRNMQVGNPRRLRVERVLVGDMQIEKLLHELWESFAIVVPTNANRPDAPPGTEWFRPEIREQLFPIIDTAVDEQEEYLTGASGEIHPRDLELLLRDAHTQHDFVAQARDEVRLLGAGGGYVTRGRRSRI